MNLELVYCVVVRGLFGTEFNVSPLSSYLRLLTLYQCVVPIIEVHLDKHLTELNLSIPFASGNLQITKNNKNIIH